MRGAPDNWDPKSSYTPPYEKLISTPANILEVAAQETPWTLEKGILRGLKVNFPWGPVGLLHVQVFDGATQIAPKGSGDFSGEGDRFEYPDWNYPLLTAPYELTVKTWNLDDTYAHAVDIYIDVSKFD